MTDTTGIPEKTPAALLSRTGELSMSQALMCEAMRHYLNNVLLKEPIDVTKVSRQTKTGSCPDHFTVEFKLKGD